MNISGTMDTLLPLLLIAVLFPLSLLWRKVPAPYVSYLLIGFSFYFVAMALIDRAHFYPNLFFSLIAVGLFIKRRREHRTPREG